VVSRTRTCSTLASCRTYQVAEAVFQLKYVVVDELHTYRGVFGKPCDQCVPTAQKDSPLLTDRTPSLSAVSATVANPREHAEDLVEKKMVLIDESGAPRSAKTFILYNPPIINRELGIRQSSLTPARQHDERPS